MKKRTVLSVILVLFLNLPTLALASDFDTLVVFGDSLSDNGNLYALDPSEVPSAYYYQGRFSNGPVWVEYLTGTDFLNCDLVDNAFAGATTDGVSPPGLINQVSNYIGSATIEDNMLFVIWIGANDFLGGSADYQTSANNIGAALDDLAAFGAENILVVNLPDLGSTPRYIGSPYENGATTLTQGFNAALAVVLDTFQNNNPAIAVYQFDVYSFLHNVSSDMVNYGFTNATEVCPSYYDVDNFDNSDGYVFWDEIHPTTEAHEALANQVLSLLDGSDGSSNGGGESGSGGGGGCFINTMRSIK